VCDVLQRVRTIATLQENLNNGRGYLSWLLYRIFILKNDVKRIWHCTFSYKGDK
jgi:hypothetical protein